MKKTIFSLLCAACCAAATAQSLPYDSLSNFPGRNVEGLVGQVLYLKNSAQARGNNGYNGFAKSPDFDLGANGRNVFRSVAAKTPLQYVSAYEQMAERYFRVEGVVTRSVQAFTRTGLTHYLQLSDMTTGEECYMVYEAQNGECFRNVAVVGHYDKMRELRMGRTYVYTGREPVAWRAKEYAGLHDMATKNPRADVPAGSEWTCSDVAIEDGGDHRMIAVMENPDLGRVYVEVADLDDLSAPNAKFTTSARLAAVAADSAASDAVKAMQEAARLKDAIAKYGEVDGPMLARRELREGMTMEMCRWALGEPFEVLTVGDGAGDTIEQWTYTDGHFLYFRAGVLFRFNRPGPYRDDTKYYHNQGGL